MELERGVRVFSAWLDERAAEYPRRLRLSYSEDRALLKTEAAELATIQAAFTRLVIETLPAGAQAQLHADDAIAPARLPDGKVS